jgi:aspartate oxidase
MHRNLAWLASHFPGVHAHLTSMSSSRPLDFTRGWIPVTPAAHYTCGGLTTDLDGRVVSAPAGRCYLNLYAAGKAARTGLHGGNQLASTSLLEGHVFSSSMGKVADGLLAAAAGREAAVLRDAACRLGRGGCCALKSGLGGGATMWCQCWWGRRRRAVQGKGWRRGGAGQRQRR